MAWAYILLGICVAAELVGSTLLTATKGFTVFKPSVIVIISYAICFACFGFALVKINLGIAYATWSAVGIIVTSIGGFLLYKQKLTKIGVASLVLITISIAVLNLYG